jgi:hypothetical protein
MSASSQVRCLSCLFVWLAGWLAGWLADWFHCWALVCTSDYPWHLTHAEYLLRCTSCCYALLNAVVDSLLVLTL